MAVCSVQDILSENPCLAALQHFDLEVIITQSLCNLRDKLENGGAVTCDIQTLLEQGECFYDLNPFMLKVIQAQLLCDISQLV